MAAVIRDIYLEKSGRKMGAISRPGGCSCAISEHRNGPCHRRAYLWPAGAAALIAKTPLQSALVKGF
jgi:hypothetical protein